MGIQNSSAELKLHAGMGEHLGLVPTAPRAALTKALIAARRSVAGTVKKDGRFDGGRSGSYNYVGHEQVINHARAVLLAHGLELTQIGVEFRGPVLWEKANGGTYTALSWRGLFELVHEESGASRTSFFDCMTLGTDKSGFIASTALDRTALLRTLQLAGSDDENPEHNSNNPPEQQQQQQRQQQTPDVAREGAAQAKAQQEQYAAELQAAVQLLDSRETPPQLMDWAVALLEHQAPKDAKLGAWAAWGKRCGAIGLDPADLKVGAIKAFKSKHGG